MENDLVTLLCENSGAPIPRHRLAFRQKEYAGNYSLREVNDPEAKRTVFMARLLSGTKDILPPLRDARVIFQERGITVVTGVEILNDLNRRRTGQTWYVKSVGYRPRDLDPAPLFVAD